VEQPGEEAGSVQQEARTCPVCGTKFFVSLADIQALLELSRSDCKQVQALAAKKLNLVHEKLRQLRRIESVLVKTLEQCARRKGNQPCPIIETLTQNSR
jgi:MerR family mercuric resistance operon transcriptional regulator